MKKLFNCADSYVQSRGWKMLAMVKFCLCAMGLILGLIVPEKHRKQFFIGAAAIFTLSYVPLMADFGAFALKHFSASETDA